MSELIAEPLQIDSRCDRPVRTPWIMAMQWHDLAFLHWPVEPERLRPFIPRGLELETFDGYAWLGVVPFAMRGVRLRGLPPLPGTGTFAELNLRTYVTTQGRPGVWFFSLDAASRLAVRIARKTFHLAYHDADMKVTTENGVISYASRRRGPERADFAGRYWPVGAVAQSEPGAIEHWLTERYCLYSADRGGRVYRGEVDHLPWPLQPAECEVTENSLASPWGIELNGPPAMVHYARRVDVVAWYLSRV